MRRSFFALLLLVVLMTQSSAQGARDAFSFLSVVKLVGESVGTIF